MAFTFGFPWRGLFSRRDKQNRGRVVKARPRRDSHVPRLDVLEDRCVPTLLPVDHGLLVYDPDAVGVRQDGSASVTGVYWLANADLAATTTFGVKGINPDGSMTWETALNWVAAMNQCNYLGHNNWTLPGTFAYDPGTLFDHQSGYYFGYDCSRSPMGRLFYTEFGGQKGASIAELHNANTRLFNHFQTYLYWSGTTRALPVDFSFGNGFLGTNADNDFMYAIPEFSADPSDVPAPPPDNNVIDTTPPGANPSLVPGVDGRTAYDRSLNITWLADANLATTQSFGVKGINPDGSMNYDTALAWIAALNAHDYLGHNNWRLPNSQESHAGYNRTGSEMGELYYTELGSRAGSTILLTHDGDARLFRNLQPYLYWSETDTSVNPNNPGENGHITFSFGSGYQGGNFDANDLYVLPVYDGKSWGPVQGAVKKPVLSAPPRVPAVPTESPVVLSAVITAGPIANDATTGPVGIVVNLGAATGLDLRADSRCVSWTPRADELALHHAVDGPGGAGGSGLVGGNGDESLIACDGIILNDLRGPL